MFTSDSGQHYYNINWGKDPLFIYSTTTTNYYGDDVRTERVKNQYNGFVSFELARELFVTRVDQMLDNKSARNKTEKKKKTSVGELLSCNISGDTRP